MKSPRHIALNWLVQVVDQGRSVNEFLSQGAADLSPQERALAKQLLFGCLRYYHQLNTLVNNLLDKPFKPKDTDLGLVILMGLYQLKYLSTPDHAAIAETVSLTQQIRKQWASGVINGVLRRYQREKAPLELSLAKSVQFLYAHPGWMVKKFQQDWADDYQSILAQNNRHAPMTIRVNTQRLSRLDYQAKLNAAGIASQLHPLAVDAIVLDKGVDVFGLPGFEQGEVTVQDAAAQMPVECLRLAPGLKVLDACAAPGGKTSHLLQREPSIDLTAIEMSPGRAEKIQQTLTRMRFNCQIKVADMTLLDDWWDGELFDRILLDVPCSASGVIRRNPDIKIHRKVTDLPALLAIQAKILQTGWRLLKPNGVLVYATCSVFKQENQQQIDQFRQQHQAEIVKLPPALHHQLVDRASIGYQILPGELAMDGFYFCGLTKKS